MSGPILEKGILRDCSKQLSMEASEAGDTKKQNPAHGDESPDVSPPLKPLLDWMEIEVL